MKYAIALAVMVINLPAFCQVIVNPDGSHSVQTGSVIVNPDGSHSTVHGSVIVNPNGTHSVKTGSVLVNPNGSHTLLPNTPGDEPAYSEPPKRSRFYQRRSKQRRLEDEPAYRNPYRPHKARQSTGRYSDQY